MQTAETIETAASPKVEAVIPADQVQPAGGPAPDAQADAAATETAAETAAEADAPPSAEPAPGAEAAPTADGSAAADAPTAPKPEAPPPLKTPDGQELRVSFAVDPVMDVKALAMAGHRIESRIVRLHNGVELTPAERRNLMPRDFENIDLQALDRGMSRLKGGDIPDKPNLIIQLSFASLSNGRARSALLERAKPMQHAMRQAVICELVDVEPGVPAGRLEEVCALVRGFFRGVWLEVEPNRLMLDSAAQAKASGLTVRSSMLGSDGPAIARGMRNFAGLVKRPTLLVATSLPSTELMMDAVKVGFSHATLRTGGKPTPVASLM